MSKWPKTCLVPLDGSDFCALALVTAEELADRLDTQVELLSAVERSDEVPRRHQELARVRLADRQPSISVVVDRDPAGIIHESLKRNPGSVACLTSHGRHRSSLLRSSVPAELIARGHDPILLSGPRIGRSKGVWWMDADLSLEKFRGGGVVVCLGGRGDSGVLLDHGLLWAASLEEPLVAVTVAEPVPPLLSDERRLFGPAGDVETFLELAVAKLLGRGVDVVTRPVFEPVSPANGVGDYLEDCPAALVVVGAHRRGTLSESGLGGTPAAIVRRSPAPVLVVP